MPGGNLHICPCQEGCEEKNPVSLSGRDAACEESAHLGRNTFSRAWGCLPTTNTLLSTRCYSLGLQQAKRKGPSQHFCQEDAYPCTALPGAAGSRLAGLFMLSQDKIPPLSPQHRELLLFNSCVHQLAHGRARFLFSPVTSAISYSSLYSPTNELYIDYTIEALCIDGLGSCSLTWHLAKPS